MRVDDGWQRRSVATGTVHARSYMSDFGCSPYSAGMLGGSCHRDMGPAGLRYHCCVSSEMAVERDRELIGPSFLNRYHHCTFSSRLSFPVQRVHFSAMDLSFLPSLSQTDIDRATQVLSHFTRNITLAHSLPFPGSSSKTPTDQQQHRFPTRT